MGFASHGENRILKVSFKEHISLVFGIMRLSWLSVAALLVFSSGRIQAAPRRIRVAVWRIDALGGVSAEIGASLESILTRELALLVSEVIPSAKTQLFQQRQRSLRACQGEDACLARIGRALRVQFVVAGTIASLGRNYVVNLKLVRSSTGRLVRRINQPFSGQPERLIQAIRLAAYKLVAPDRLLGNLQILVDHPGAKIYVDGNLVGTSPLRTAIQNLKVGPHVVRVTHPDYLEFVRRVHVRFEKTTYVKIHLVRPKISVVRLKGGVVVRDAPTPVYAKWWFWTSVGVAAAALGAVAGWAIGKALVPSAPTVYVCSGQRCWEKGTTP